MWLSALALVSHQFFLQLFYTFFQLFYLVGLRLNCFVLGLSAAQSGSRHAFFYAAFFNEGLFQLGQLGGHHPVHLSAEGEGQVGQLLVRGFGEHTAEVLQFVVGAAISQHVCKAGMAVIPFAQVAGSEVVLVIFLQLLNAYPRHIDEPDFHFRGADTIGAALRYVLFPRTSRLLHLVNGTVIYLQEARCKSERQLVQHVRLFVEEQLFVIYLPAKEMSHVFLFLVFLGILVF